MDCTVCTFIVKVVTSVHRVYSKNFFPPFKERQRQGHKDGTSDIYWDSWDTGKTREKTISTSLSERSSRSSVTLDNDIPLSSPSSDADTEGSRLSTLSASDTDTVLSPKQYSPLPFHYTVRTDSPTSPLKRSVSDEVNLGKKHHLKNNGCSIVGFVFLTSSFTYMGDPFPTFNS